MNSHLLSELIRSLQKMDHFDAASFLRVHESGEHPVSVHLNIEKLILSQGKWPAEFTDPAFQIAGKVAWAPDAFYLAKRPSFTLDPVFHSGAYYVQEASGMFLTFALQQIADLTKRLKVLDLCAAPGGKSTLIQSLISAESVLVSNEVIKTRVPVLIQNMTKWGRTNGIVCNNDPLQFKKVPGFFDILLIDAPCSGSGLYRKDPEAAASWTEDLVKVCSKRQQRIIGDAWDCLKEDGFLIYCTCSYSKEENEDILDIIFQQNNCKSITLSPDPSWNIIETTSDRAGAVGYRFYPYRLAGEGFFLSVIQKKQSVGNAISSKLFVAQPLNTAPSNKRKSNPTKISKSAELQIKPWLEADALELITIGDSTHALTKGLANDLESLKKNLYLKKAGVRVGKTGEHEWIPDHELALATLLKTDSSSISISKSDALHFLKGEPFESGTSEKGWHLATYHGQRLGWVKLLERRMNNYYPKSWRIRQ